MAVSEMQKHEWLIKKIPVNQQIVVPGRNSTYPWVTVGYAHGLDHTKILFCGSYMNGTVSGSVEGVSLCTRVDTSTIYLTVNNHYYEQQTASANSIMLYIVYTA